MILVALGANLPGPDGAPPIETCRRAAAQLDGLLGCRLRGLSRWFRTAPVPDAGQPAFINGVAQLAAPPGEHPPDPVEVLRALLTLEQQHGRTRRPGSIDRTLDLDLLAAGDRIENGPDLLLPHPRLHLRRFVLDPLCDLAPGWTHPILGRTARALLADVLEQACAPVPTSA